MVTTSNPAWPFNNADSLPPTVLLSDDDGSGVNSDRSASWTGVEAPEGAPVEALAAPPSNNIPPHVPNPAPTRCSRILRQG